jgi:hypothetical protein
VVDDDRQDEPEDAIVAVSASVLYDGSIAVLVSVPGEDEPVETVFSGDANTLLVVWGSERAQLEVDLDGTTTLDRRCQEIVRRGVARLNDDLARRRAAERRAREREREQQEASR